MFSSARMRALACLPLVPLAACAHDDAHVDTAPALTAALERAPVAPDARGAPVSLVPDDVAALAVAQSPQLEPLRHAARERAAMARAVGDLDDPMVEARIAPLSVGGLAGIGDAPFGAELMVSQQLSFTSRLDDERRAAEHDAAAQALTFDDARHAIALAARTAACDAWQAQRALEAHERHLAGLGALRASASDRIAVGAASVDDALMVDDEIARAETERLGLAGDHDVALVQINALLGRAPDAPLPSPPVELARTEPTAGSERSDVAALEHGIARATALEDARGTAWIPDVAVQGGYSSMWPHAEHQVTVGVQIEFPLHTGRRDAELEAAQSRARMASAERDARAQEVNAMGAAARRRLVQARALLAHHEQTIAPIAERRRVEADSAFATGAGALAAVLQARIAADDARVEIISARAQVCRAEAELAYAIRSPLPEVTQTTIEVDE